MESRQVNVKFGWLTYLALALFVSAQAQSPFQGREHLFTQPKSYIIYRANERMIIDGYANEPSWQLAPWSSEFVDIEGALKPKPSLRTRFKMLWDKQNLYVHAELDEPHLWGTLTRQDEIVYNDNDFEIFIDPDGDSHQYYEIEVNILQTILDLYMDKPYRNGGKPHIDWNAADLRTGVVMNGTLNKPNDQDKNWTLEMAIPFSALQKEKPTPVPQGNTVWRMNFSRVEWNLEIIDNQYQRKKDANQKLLPENNWVWSEQGIINMHFPERWGYVIFSNQPVETDQRQQQYLLPFAELAKKYLWLIYYKQKDYLAEHKHYAQFLSQLGFSSDVIYIGNKSCKISLTATEKEFIASIQCEKHNEKWQILQDGMIKEKH